MLWLHWSKDHCTESTQSLSTIDVRILSCPTQVIWWIIFHGNVFIHFSILWEICANINVLQKQTALPSRCCVTNFKDNYGTELRMNVFSFPMDSTPWNKRKIISREDQEKLQRYATSKHNNTFDVIICELFNQGLEVCMLLNLCKGTFTSKRINEKKPSDFPCIYRQTIFFVMSSLPVSSHRILPSL